MSDNKKVNNISSDTLSDIPATPQKKYFEAVSDKYRKVSHILYIALAVCFLLTLLFNAKLLTYNNFNYLIKDLNAAIDLASENYDSISYTNDELRVTKNFRGGIITASTSEMAIYTATGKKTLQSNEVFISPQIAVSQKYAIIYDLGGNNYNVYNSFAKVHSGNSEFSIGFVTVSESGWYAIVSKDSDHNAVVRLYDNDFELRSTYYYAHKYVFSVSINNDASKIGIVTTESDKNGDKFSTFVDLYEPGKSSASFSVPVGSALPCGSSFNDQNAIQIVCTDGVYTVDENNGTIINSYSLSFEQISKVSINKFGCAVVASDINGSSENTVLVFNKSGELIYDSKTNSGVFDLELFEDSIFISQSNSILKINVKDGQTDIATVFEKGFDIVVYDSNNILLCCQTKAKHINF